MNDNQIKLSSKVTLPPIVPAKKITLEGQLETHRIKPRSLIIKTINNLLLKIEKLAIGFKFKDKIKEEKFHAINAKKINSMNINGEIIHISTKNLLKALHLENTGPDTLEEYQQQQIISHINDEKILTQTIYDQLEIIQNEENRRAAVRELLMEEVPEHIKTQLSTSIEFLKTATVDLNSIDNQESTRKSYVEALASGSCTASGKDEGPIATNNMSKADLMVRDWAKSGKPLDLNMISELNKCLTSGTKNNGSEPGVYRKTGISIQTGQGRYLAGSHVKSEMTELCQWLNSELEKANHEPIKVIEIAARAMRWAVSCHPFSDGNGRTSRMLVNYILLKAGLPPAIMDEKRGKAAMFGDSFIGLKTDMSLTENEKQTIINGCGPKVHIVMDNVIESIRLMVNKFGKH